MAGIYIHIPYCKQACTYCDFYFSTTLSSKPKFISSLLKEIELQKNFFCDTKIETIYFGGGTPSLLTKNELIEIIDCLRNNFSVSNDAEITLEANPENLSNQYLKDLLELGVNRLSIGLQSFKESELIEMNRAHNANQNFEAIKTAQEIGFNNISVDLIYGTPWTDELEWENHLNKVIELNVQHISCYQLTVEEKTILYHKIKERLVPLPNDERTEKQFLMLIAMMKQAGFVHYEISNFGKPTYFSRHNTSYWKDIPYLGLGPSAHSYNGHSRFSTIANIHLYNNFIDEQKGWFTEEKLTLKEQYNDLVLTGLRTIWGVNLTQMEKKLDQSFVNYFQRKAQAYVESGQIIKDGYKYHLIEESFLFADKISSNLFYI